MTTHDAPILKRRSGCRNRLTLVCILGFWMLAGCRRPAPPSPPSATPLDALKKAIQELPVPDPGSLEPIAREQFETDYAAVVSLSHPLRTPERAFAVARLLHSQDRLEPARDWYGFILDLVKRGGFERFDDDQFLCWYYIADIARRQEQWETALKAVNAALTLHEKDEHALLMRADLLRTMNAGAGGHPAAPDAEVRKAYERVLAQGEVAEAYYGLGRLEAARANPLAAEEHYRKAIALAPQFLPAREALAALLTSAGKAQEAESLLAAAPAGSGGSAKSDPRLRAVDPGVSLKRFKQSRALRLAMSGRAEEAETELRFELLANPDDAELFDLLGTIINAYRVSAAEPAYRRLLVGEAKRCFLKAIQLDPAYLPARENYALLLEQRENNRDLALEQFREILLRDNTYWRAHYHIADLLANMPLDAQRRATEQVAEDHYRKVLDYDADNMLAFSGLASLLERQGRYAEAFKLLKQAVELAPDDPGVADQYARLMLTSPRPELRNPVEALKITERINEVTNNLTRLEFPEYLETLALAYIENAQLGGGRNLETLAKAYDAIRKSIDSASAQGRDEILPRLRETRSQIEGWLREAGRLPK